MPREEQQGLDADDLDLAELRAFAGLGGWAGASADTRASQNRSSELAKASNVSVKGELPLPPGFECGPDTGTYANPLQAAAGPSPSTQESAWSGFHAQADAKQAAPTPDSNTWAAADTSWAASDKKWSTNDQSWSNSDNTWSAGGDQAGNAWSADNAWSQYDAKATQHAADTAVAQAAPSAPADTAWGGLAPTGGLVDDGNGQVLVEQEDPTAPYLAATSWEELKLPKEVQDGIFEMGFVRPSKIQEWALPIAFGGGNIIGQAQNGSGKTAAFTLAMLQRIDPTSYWPQGVCISPTRELAMQIFDVLGQLGKYTGITMYLSVRQAERPPRTIDSQLIVGTPGKFQDFLKRKTIDPSGMRIFVIDEADVMIDEANQMGPQVLHIKNWMPADVQVLLFSATWPDHVQKFAKRLVPKANGITVQKKDLTLNTIMQTYIKVSDRAAKIKQLSDLYNALNVGQSVIFVNSRKWAFELAKRMKNEGHTVSLICGTQKTGGPEDIDEAYRDWVMNEFRQGITKVLVTTDVLARGIDVPAVTLVVNYDLPEEFGRRGSVDFETYMHRIGRTGRFGLKGIAVNLVCPEEIKMVHSIMNFYNCKIHELCGDCEEIESMLKRLR